MDNQILSEIKNVIVHSIGGDFSIDSLDGDFQLVGNILDSMAVTTLIISLEEHFGFMFDDEDLDAESFETINSLSKLVEKKLSS